MGNELQVITERRAAIGFFFRSNLRNIVLLIVIILLSLIFFSFNPQFISLANMMNIMRRVAPLFLISIGMAMVILTGNLDLSVASNTALCGAVGAFVITNTGNPYLAIFFTILCGVAVGFINGIAIGKLKLNAVVFTLAMLGMLRSLNIIVLGAKTRRIESDIYNWLGGSYFKVSESRIYVTLFFIILFYIIFHALMNFTIFGRKLKAIGSNPFSSRAVGILVERNVLFIFIIVGFLVGVAGLITVGRSAAAATFSAVGLEFEAITAVIIGGSSLEGGKIDLIGTFLGVILLGMIISGLTLIRVPAIYIELIKGIILLMAITVNYFTQKYQREY